MIFLPIVDRETARGGAAARHVLGACAGRVGAVAIGAWCLLVMAKQPSNINRENLLSPALSTLAFGYALLRACRSRRCLSEEKREGPRLLFLTDLKGYDVVLGKLAANFFEFAVRHGAIFPVYGHPLLLGGVTPAEFWPLLSSA